MFNASTARRYSQPLGYRKFRASRAGRGGPSPCHQIAKTRLRGIHRCGRNDRISKEASSTGTHGPSGRDTVTAVGRQSELEARTSRYSCRRPHAAPVGLDDRTADR